MSDAAVAAIIAAVTSGLAGLIGQLIQRRRAIYRLRQRLDAMVAAALELAMRETPALAEEPVPFAQVADLLLARELATTDEHEELLALWDVRKSFVNDAAARSLTLRDARALLVRLETLMGTLGEARHLAPGEATPGEGADTASQGNRERKGGGMNIRITLSSIFVDDQERALAFYTEVLGFEVKSDIPMGEARWLTLVSPAGSPESELVLEPNTHPAARVYQEAIHRDGIPSTSFAASDVQAEYERLKDLGVVFRTEPTDMGGVTVAIFEDTCGNLIQLHQG